MKRTVSLKLNKDFRRLYYRGKNVVGSYVAVYAAKNRQAQNRLGLTCGKAIGNAVTRNRVKRLMREAYRLCEDRILPGYDIVLVARKRAVGKDYARISKDIRYAFHKLELIKKDEETDAGTHSDLSESNLSV